MADRKHPELAKRLAVAVGSYRGGFKSMDYFTRRYETVEIADFWHELADRIMAAMDESGHVPTEISKLIH